ncbi:hypothetical protein B0H15DRAFT_329278 [Mycena belliarum]|uniref:WD-like domain-containing protein n=1 Tax=Mycena belliarum TaxID=1033014 RepID=A0AAD6XTN0_9AGAR|nr:hypothetical protein B0H15DRAFT_329278 [Mycena belliae]
MQFSKLPIAAVLALAAAFVHAAPPETYPGLVVSKVVPMGEYTLTYWSDAPGTIAGDALGARAPIPCSGNNDVTCSGSHKAESGICNQLVNSLHSNSGTVIGDSPRSICLGQGGNQCCVSWSAAVGSLPQGDLFDAAKKIFSSCFGATISGLARNVNLNGGCVTECLSNRPTGCS